MRIYFMAILIGFAGCALHETKSNRIGREAEEKTDVAVDTNQATVAHSSNVCPKCNSSDQVRPIMYGFPLAHVFEAESRGDLILGGCVPMNESKGCLICGHRW